MIECKYSIIVPAYNNQEGVDSIVTWFIQNTTQSNNAELIIIDDGSFNPIRITVSDSIILFRQKNSGVSAARNKGIDIARGEYIAFLDSDDYFNDDVFTIWDRTIKDSESTLMIFPPTYYDIASNYKDCKKHYIEAKSYESSCATKAYFNKNIYTHICSILVSKRHLEDNDIRFNTTIHLSEDILFIVECFKNSKQVKISNERYYNYLIGLPSATNGMASMKILNNIDAFKQISRLEFNNKEKKSKNFFVATMYISLLIRLYKNKTINKEVITEIVKEKSLLHKEMTFPFNKKGIATFIASIVFYLPDSLIIYFMNKGCLRDS